MTDNNRVLLDAIIEQSKKAQASDYSDADYFELFTAENILKQEALSYDELESGLVGAGGDGGLDAAYFLIDGRLVREDTDPDDFKKKPNFEIYFVQAKRTGGFDESAIDKFISVTENLFDLGKDLGNYILYLAHRLRHKALNREQDRERQHHRPHLPQRRQSLGAHHRLALAGRRTDLPALWFDPHPYHGRQDPGRLSPL